MPHVIRTLIAINTVVFVIMALSGSYAQVIIQYFALDPELGTALTQPWRLVTYMFLHGSGFHLLFNMLWLWWMGRMVEESIGPRSFSVLFFGSGIGGAIFHIALSFLYGTTFVVGASGAVFGVMVAFAYLYPRIPIMLLLLPPIEARFVVAGIIVLDVLLLGSGDAIARIVHLGGAGVGYLIIKAHYTGTDLSKFIRPIERLWSEKPKKKKRKKNKNMYSVSDVEIVDESSQTELDDILEKISKEGYDGLTSEEKKKLFDLSKKN